MEKKVEERTKMIEFTKGKEKKIERNVGRVGEKEDNLDPREFPKLSICASDEGIGR